MRFGVKSAVLGLAAALALGGLARAQELQLDQKALDAGVAAAGKKVRNTHALAPGAPAPAERKPGKPQGGKTPDRQFGELEGWSPGKAPPKPKDKDDATSSNPRGGGLGVSPSGNMSVGLPF